MRANTLYVFIFLSFFCTGASHAYAATVVTDTVDTSVQDIILTGTSTETGATITDIEYQVNATNGLWTGCTATDGVFDADSEGFTCTLGSFSADDYTIYIRTTANTPLGFQATTTDWGSNSSIAKSIIADEDNVYVTGSCDGCPGAFATMVYDREDGSYVWSTSTAPSDGIPQGIDVDDSNIYITGWCDTCGAFGYAFFTIAYDKADGSFLWSTTNDLGSDDVGGYGIISDDDNVYVTGYCDDCFGADYSAYTIAYDKTDGSLVWATSTSPDSDGGWAYAIDIDEDTVYVTGGCYCGTLGYDFFTIAYDKLDGSFLWSTTTDPSPDHYNEAYSITVDSENVYITGYCQECGMLGDYAFFTIAYDKTDGSFVWSTTTDVGSDEDYGHDLVADSENVFVTGFCTNCDVLGGNAFHTIAYDKSDGSLIWSTTTDATNGDDRGNSVALYDDILYVTGVTQPLPLSQAFYTIAYDKATGNTYTTDTDTDNVAFSIEPTSSGSTSGTRTNRTLKQTVTPIDIEIAQGTPTIESLRQKLTELQTLLEDLLAKQGIYPARPFTTDLTLGSTHPDVVRLQQHLVSRGYLTIPFGVPYGYFGSLTQSALAKFQKDYKISPSQGYFGPITRAFLNR